MALPGLFIGLAVLGMIAGVKWGVLPMVARWKQKGKHARKEHKKGSRKTNLGTQDARQAFS